MLEISDYVTIAQINASANRGGWECRFTSLQDTDIVELWQRICVQFRGAFGGPPGVLRTGFVGYVMPTRFQFDLTGSRAEFVAQTSDGFLRRGWLQGIGFADTDGVARAHYHQFDNVTGAPPERMTCGRIVRHILGYYDQLGAPPGTNPDWVAHTNMVYHPTENPHGWIDLSNVDLTGSCRVDRYIVRETDNLWARLREIAENEFYFIWCDKHDNLYYQRHPMFSAPLPAPVMTFDEDFCGAPPVVEVRDRQQVRQVQLHAVTDAGGTMHANYPDYPTPTYGNVLDRSHIRCNNVAWLNAWAKRLYLWENRQYTVRWTVAGIAGLLFDLLDRVEITYSGTDANGVHIDWDRKRFWIHEIVVVPGEQFGGRTTFVLEEENA